MREEIAEHARQVRQDVVVPVSNDRHSFVREPACATVIGLLCLFGVLSAVDFDGQTQARTIKVERVRPDWVLPSKMKTVELIPAKCAPQSAFGVSHVTAKLSRSRSHCNSTTKPWSGPPPVRFAADLPFAGGG
jgi:hypothetical protein